ncbi:uncharacterized protein AAG666_019481 isoform 1-T1 [Megaptera novaeangliae]
MDTTLRKGSEAEVRSVGPWPELGETRAAAACPACPRPPAGGARGPPGATGGAGARPGAGPVPGRAGRWGNVLVGCRWVLTAQAPLKLGLSLPLLFRPRRTTRTVETEQVLRTAAHSLGSACASRLSPVQDAGKQGWCLKAFRGDKVYLNM